MRYAVPLVLLIAVSCVGCVQTGQGWRMPAAQYRRGRSRGRSAAVPRPLQQRECVSVGLSLGDLAGVGSEAVDGFRHSKFKAGTLTGISATYIFPADAYTAARGFLPRYGTELRIEDYSMLLTEEGFDFGKLHMISAVFAFKYLHVPKEEHFFGFHFDLGFGWGSSSFSKDDMLEQDDILQGIYTEISPGPASVIVGGAGVDFYLAPDVCMSLDLRYSSVIVPVDWTENDVRRSDIDWFNASTQQIVIGFSFFF